MQPKRAEIQPQSKDTIEMMKHRLLLAAALLLPVAALADPVTVTRPDPIAGQGQLIMPVSTSTPVGQGAGALTLAPGSVFPVGNLPGLLTIRNNTGSANPLFVCWLGGTCSATVGEPLAAGEAKSMNLQGRNMQQQPPTVFSVAATITVLW